MLRTEISIGMAMILACWMTVSMRAQDGGNPRFEYRIEAFGDVATVHVRNLIVTNHRDGWGFTGGLGWRPFRTFGRGLGFEMRVARIAHDGAPGDGAPNYDRWNALLVAATALYHFRSGSRTQPYLIGGFGFMRTSGFFYCADCVWDLDPATGRRIYIEDRRTGSGSDHGPILGCGLKVAVTRHVFFRAELMELFATGGTRWSWNSASVGMGVRY